MPEYRRPRHRAVARLLAAFDAAAFERACCFFGGGTRIVLELGEFRESQDVDFLCADVLGYQKLRAGVTETSLGAILPALPHGIELLREVRADQYGIRTIFVVDGEPVKFDLIREARIALASTHVDSIPLPVLDRPTCFAEKLLANADRGGDVSFRHRDAIDLAFMLSAWSAADADAGARVAITAYGASVARAAKAAASKLTDDKDYRRQCAHSLMVDDTKTLTKGLQKLQQFVAGLR